MASSIVFNDGASATLNNGRSAPFDRFWQWTPSRIDVGPKGVPVGTGVTNVFIFRTDHCVSIELRDIPESMHAIALRLIQHLTRGGTATLNAGDPAANTYTVRLRPGTEPTLSIQDERRPSYVFKAELKNTAAVDLLSVYGG